MLSRLGLWGRWHGLVDSDELSLGCRGEAGFGLGVYRGCAGAVK